MGVDGFDLKAYRLGSTLAIEDVTFNLNNLGYTGMLFSFSSVDFIDFVAFAVFNVYFLQPRLLSFGETIVLR